jgi:hypothetical protein
LEEEREGNADECFGSLVAVCSLLGYRAFLKSEWMYEILFWEQSLSPNSACFTDSESTDLTSDPASGSVRRKKRSDALIGMAGQEGHCSVHFTAVSVAALALHLRHFIEFCANPSPSIPPRT